MDAPVLTPSLSGGRNDTIDAIIAVLCRDTSGCHKLRFSTPARPNHGRGSQPAWAFTSLAPGRTTPGCRLAVVASRVIAAAISILAAGLVAAGADPLGVAVVTVATVTLLLVSARPTPFVGRAWGGHFVSLGNLFSPA